MRRSEPAIALRPVEPGDRDLLLEWANDPATRAASFYPARIEPDAHRRWFAARLGSPDAGIWIGEIEGRPIGQVRVIRTDGTKGEVSISLATEARGRGLARPLLLAALSEAAERLGVTTFVAAVRPGNGASLALFRGAGFSDELPGERNGVPCRVLVRRRAPVPDGSAPTNGARGVRTATRCS